VNIAFNWLSMTSDTVNDDPTQRAKLRQKLGLEPYLARREVLRFVNDEIHAELYTYDEAAPVILFLPGIGTYSELYAECLSDLSDTGFNVIGIDLRGHGYSKGARGDYRVEQVVQDLVQIVDALSERFKGPIGVYGYSIGGLLAVALAERDARIKSILCGTLLVTEIAPDLLHQFGWAWTWGTSLFFPAARLPLKSFIDYDQLLSGHPAGREINNDPRIIFDYPIGTLASLFTHTSGVAKKVYPFRSAIIHGEHDEVLPYEYSEQVVRTLRHPFELIKVPGEGHMIPWDNPKHLSQVVSDWFKRSF